MTRSAQLYHTSTRLASQGSRKPGKQRTYSSTRGWGGSGIISEPSRLRAACSTSQPRFRTFCRRFCPRCVLDFRLLTRSFARPTNQNAQHAHPNPISNTSTRSSFTTRPPSQVNMALLSTLCVHSCHHRHAYSTKRVRSPLKFVTNYQVVTFPSAPLCRYKHTVAQRFAPFQTRTFVNTRNLSARCLRWRTSPHSPWPCSVSVSSGKRMT